MQHVDSSVHKDKLAQVRMRRAVFEDISEDTGLAPFDDMVRSLFLVLFHNFLIHESTHCTDSFRVKSGGGEMERTDGRKRISTEIHAL